MVYLELVENNETQLVYDYMPESIDAAKGRVSVNKITFERKLIKKSLDNSLPMYYGHAWKAIEKMIRSGIKKEKTYVAWY